MALVYFAFFQDLDTALQLLRALVSEVNHAVTEEENVFLLRWAQSHVKCPPLLRLDFTSDTRLLGLRSFLHSGVLYKQRSGRLLVAILFNDFLLLTTPDEHLSKPISFKISKTTELHLTLYKQPMLLANLKVMPSNDETTLNIKQGMDTISFRCVSSNARRLWTSQLEQAIDLYAITASEQEQARQILRLSVGRVSETFEVDLLKTADLHLTTQFPLENTTALFTLKILQKNLYRPDALLFDEATASLNELLRESAVHRGPIIKAMQLRKDIRDKAKPVESVTVKFVAQLFDANM
ncbi:hypothetical protein TELCIR_17641 [Teladorsagia circumcincta]|uniref:PH domain-containing protein n=1 Tax=Teladorsagia circumcincta TaxID=45464 RepID=A0A2G9TS63_TELCI|nr:hypothetical protein TELCIR_17641 [Teladorsagia circumcincta]